MREDRFYIREPAKQLIDEPSIVHKIRNVLRKKEGQTIILFDGKGREYQALISRVNSQLQLIELAKLKIIRKAKASFKLSLGFSLLKSKKQDFIFQKATELGVDEFIPFISQNSVIKKFSPSKLTHYQRIVIEASSQSRRLFLPRIKNLTTLPDLIKNRNFWDGVLVAESSSPVSIIELFRKDRLKNFKNILLLVGPEGGFSSQELKKLKKLKNTYLVKISGFNLRAETASIFLAGLVGLFLRKNED